VTQHFCCFRYYHY